MTSPQDVTQMLAELSAGRTGALDELLPVVYRELHNLAAHYLKNERTDHTLQATALVHEAYLKLIDQREARWQNRAHFFAVAAQLMRRILVDYARTRLTAKRGGDWQRLSLDEVSGLAEQKTVDLIALDDALNALAALDERQSRIVELRYFGGLSIEETAEVTDLSPATVKREWNTAKAFLRHHLTRQE